MRLSRPGLIAVLALLGVWFIFGSGCAVRRAAQRVKETNDLKEVGLMYANYCIQYNKPPTSIDDFAQYASEYVEGYRGLQSGNFVFLYGASPKNMTQGTSNTVLAYQKDVPTKGGLVLMADASVKEMTASQFASATKATPDVKR